jgi:hypothetical protein
MELPELRKYISCRPNLVQAAGEQLALPAL